MPSQLNDGIIEYICEGGSGGEATVRVELRTRFPGIGGTIITQEGAVTALRREYNPTPKSAHRMFLRHMVLKKLEDFFYRTHVYRYAHIPRPLGSVSNLEGTPSEAYLYEWAFGQEGFPWEESTAAGGHQTLQLHDWNKFVASFYGVGIDISRDITDADDGRISKNIIHQLPIQIPGQEGEMNSLWKRIDFGYASLLMDYEALARFLKDNNRRLMNTLRCERVSLLELAVDYLAQGPTAMPQQDIGRLDVLVGQYRQSTLQHYISRGSGLSDNIVCMRNRTESLS